MLSDNALLSSLPCIEVFIENINLVSVMISLQLKHPPLTSHTPLSLIDFSAA